MKSIYFIAEIGKACNGDLDYCEEILKECKKTGVDAVRFHHFSLEESVYRDVLKKETERAWSFKLQLPFINETLFSVKDYQKILNLCKELELDFIGSPWDLKSFELFKSLNISHYKINSLNLMNIPLLRAVLNERKRTFLSTGGMAEQEIEKLCLFMNLSRQNVVLLHTVLAYPAPSNIVNIRGVEILNKYHDEVGYSSNDLTSTAILTACTLGATVIEKHVHLSGKNNEVHRASVEVSQFGEEITKVKEMQEITCRKIKQEARGEMINQELLSKSLIIRNDISKGEVVREQDLTAQLPPKGIHCKNWFEVIDHKATEALKKGNHLFSTQIESFEKKNTTFEGVSSIPGKRGVVVRFKDIDDIIQGHNFDYVEMHYAAGDLKKDDICKDYDLDLVVHMPEYADGKLLDLSSRDKSLKDFSIEIINQVMERTRKLKPHFKKCNGPIKFVIHAGGLTYPDFDIDVQGLNEIFVDSMKQLDTYGLEILLENMNPFAWFLDGDWSPKQGKSNNFMDAIEIAGFCKKYNYSMCLDVCHAKLYCNNYHKDLAAYMRIVKPYVKHIHYSDCYGVDGEGLQVGDGENQWQDICEVFEDFKEGWTPEIWNGHLDRGAKFHEAHKRLSQEFTKYLKKKQAVTKGELINV